MQTLEQWASDEGIDPKTFYKAAAGVPVRGRAGERARKAVEKARAAGLLPAAPGAPSESKQTETAGQ